MTIRPSYAALIFVPFLLFGCARHQTGGAEPSGNGVSMRDGATILEGPALDDGRGSLLDAMRGKVPNLRIQLFPRDCPRITIRSHATFTSVVEPHIYVDGTRATNTCVLDQLQSQDVEMVEVYPMGFTKRPGYGTHAHGLILIFMRTE